MKTTNAHGFTLYELLICMAIMGFIVGIAVPNLIQLFIKFESDTLKSQIRMGLSSARNHSISLGKTVTLCGINSNSECSRIGFKEMAIFVDDNNNHTIDEDEKLIAISDIKYRGQLYLRASFGRSFIQFKNDGSTKQSGSFIYCSPKHPHVASRITVSMAGRTYIGKDLDGDAIVEYTSGRPILC